MTFYLNQNYNCTVLGIVFWTILSILNLDYVSIPLLTKYKYYILFNDKINSIIPS